MQQDNFADLVIGTRLKRVYELLSIDLDRVYKEAGLNFTVRHFPVVYALNNVDGLSISELQKISVLTHSAISQTVKQLVERNIVMMSVGEDARSRIVHLTKQGESLVKKLFPIWEMVNIVIQEIRQESANDLLLALNDFEENLLEKGFYQRYSSHISKAQKSEIIPEISIIPFHVKYRKDWYEINKEWVENLFVLEEADRESLENPEKYILAQGGEIYFAVQAGNVLGAAALKNHGQGEYEVSKMGVRPKAQRLGIGKQLLNLVIERYHARGGKKLYLETNSKLTKAISLYEKAGFVHVPSRENTPYARADVCMEYQVS